MNLAHIADSWKHFTEYCKRRWSRLVGQQLQLLTGNRHRPQPMADQQQPIQPPK